ncbi:hypothetical protein ACFPRL_30935 [Pseudoclavibacter helvolus]
MLTRIRDGRTVLGNWLCSELCLGEAHFLVGGCDEVVDPDEFTCSALGELLELRLALRLRRLLALFLLAPRSEDDHQDDDRDDNDEAPDKEEDRADSRTGGLHELAAAGAGSGACELLAQGVRSRDGSLSVLTRVEVRRDRLRLDVTQRSVSEWERAVGVEAKVELVDAHVEDHRV